jgi:hypothetical protein
MAPEAVAVGAIFHRVTLAAWREGQRLLPLATAEVVVVAERIPLARMVHLPFLSFLEFGKDDLGGNASYAC